MRIIGKSDINYNICNESRADVPYETASIYYERFEDLGDVYHTIWAENAFVTCLGEYKTKERCIEVLDLIFEAHMRGDSAYNMPEE